MLICSKTVVPQENTHLKAKSEAEQRSPREKFLAGSADLADLAPSTSNMRTVATGSRGAKERKQVTGRKQSKRT